MTFYYILLAWILMGLTGVLIERIHYRKYYSQLKPYPYNLQRPTKSLKKDIMSAIISGPFYLVGVLRDIFGW
jgi:hypothetical protein